MGVNEESFRLKLERADKHIRDAMVAIDAFCHSHPYAIGVKPHSVPEIAHVTLYVKELREIPFEIPLIVGDAVHNLRSALDHLACRLVISNGERPTRDTEFPICDPAKEYTSAFSERKIKGMSVGAQKFIAGIQPRQAGDHTLWNLHRLDIEDKHRLFITAQLAAEDWTIDAFGSGHLLAFKMVEGTLMLGDHISSLPIATYAGQKHENFKLTLDIAFGDSEVVEGKPIRSTLNGMANFVKELIGKLERFIV